jgi:CBS-domain-containing membrane protein
MTVTSAAARRTLTAYDVMSCPAIVVSLDSTLCDAARLMMTSGVRHLVVCSQGRVVGTIDDRAAFGHWPMGPVTLRRAHLGDIVRRRTSCVLPSVELQRVAELMMIDGCEVVPVVDDAGAVLGVVTASDLVAAVASDTVTDEA